VRGAVVGQDRVDDQQPGALGHGSPAVSRAG
jgi:hypothetical protein